MFSIEDIIDLAIQIEQNAEKVYRNAQAIASTFEVAALLKWLADEEKAHAKWFSRLRKTVNIEPQDFTVQDPDVQDPDVQKMGKSLLRDVLGTQSFSLEDAEFSKIRRLAQLLSVAIEFERDKVTFYGLLQPFISDTATQDFLEAIILEEKNHIRRLQDFLTNRITQDVMVSQNQES
jgi:rubrerythrin